MILDLLGLDTHYGLDLVDASSGRLKRASIYVTLARMEKKGLIESHQEERRPGTPGLPRRLYRATAFGMRARDAFSGFRQTMTLIAAEAQS